MNNNLAKRIIPCMDVADGKVVKGINFKNLKTVGDAVKLGKYYSENGADELIFLDITATKEKRKTLIDLVKKVSKNIFIPFNVGGGIKTIDDIQSILLSGADKISICSEAIKNPKLVKKASKRFGSQCIVISLDCKRKGDSWTLFINGGSKETEIDAIKFAKKMEKLGAGELLVNSLDEDGTKQGYDLKLLEKISQNVNIPVIASSGVGKKEDFTKAFEYVDACLAASIFHSKIIKIPKLKKYLSKFLTIRI
ncbi:imidazole glycerol phosphate synthase subunit HisF [Patescibacteria group bacterium]